MGKNCRSVNANNLMRLINAPRRNTMGFCGVKDCGLTRLKES